MTTVGAALAEGLAVRGIQVAFGIPGVHTVEIYRGLAASGLRHVTARHEQGAAFMADGYARVAGRPAAICVITGPGLTNALTGMAQARADSVPMLVVSGAGATAGLGRGLGYLHELPNQRALAAQVALASEQVDAPEDLGPALDRTIAPFSTGRPGPTHIAVPLDVASMPCPPLPLPAAVAVPEPDAATVVRAARYLSSARAPVILAGGGCRRAAAALRAVAEALGAPVVQTVNARGTMHAHPLGVPASPSLGAVRALIEGADVVLAVGTELGRTDFDMYATGTMPRMRGLVRIDRCADQLVRHPAKLVLHADAGATLAALRPLLTGPPAANGAGRAAATRAAAWAEMGPALRAASDLLGTLRDAVPGAVIVGDSTHPVYAGNLFYDHDRPGGWFNAATGFGALGYAIPAAIGAAVADPDAPVICLTGDGGAQFTLPEVMTAVDERLPILFLVWNNRGYAEIASAMRGAGTPALGCDPTPPDFAHAARSFGIPHALATPDSTSLRHAVAALSPRDGPAMLEIAIPAAHRSDEGS
ncbi:5-guanidino-2-oxopentanoate decarboxylase [Jannaschia sp. LMIT008]|uniref:5-guanidino-2-oxopentanoate decarboxylase n=1 Tax=Jannaschia maritima TaxID=3032585 RepID=UPI00281111D4|nr:5-guanidino-2-oxopentanoate decarboxylase [Jannaschia sp. LMIT008]